MRFGKSLHRLLDYILEADHKLGQTFLSKFDLDDTYMHIWVWFDIPYVDFLVPKETNSEPQLVGFNLSITMGYMESTPFFCAATETIKDIVNNIMHKRGDAPVHPLDILSETLHGDHNQLWEEREASTDKVWNNIPALTPRVHNEINLWRDFITYLSSRPTLLREITSHPPT